MKLNVGGIDRVMRIGVGFALVPWALMGGPLWAWIGVIPLVTGVVGFCPLYPLVGIRTCPAKN